MGLADAKKGDEPRVQQQMVPLSFEAAPPAPPPAVALPVPPEDQEEEEDEDATDRALRETRAYRDERRHAA